jgi:hypothetical protein
MLLVITGAGASFDSAPSFPANRASLLPEKVQGHEVDRPPLAAQLFEGRPEFVSAMRSVDRVLDIVPHLQRPIEGVSLEQTLQSFQIEAEKIPRRHQQLAAVRYYLHLMISQCEHEWQFNVTKGITNYRTLLDHIERWRKPSERVVFVTFNYDTMLESDLRAYGVLQIESLDDYISDSKYRLIKLHGSWNWAREVDTPIRGIDQLGPWQLVHDLIKRAADLKISNRYQIATDRPITKAGVTVLFPAIAIPVETKSSYECPSEHLDALKEFLPQVTKILIIGWRAAEQTFLSLLAKTLPAEGVKGLVIAGGEEPARQAIVQLQQAGVPGVYWNTTGGFTDFILNRRGDDFLRE